MATPPSTSDALTVPPSPTQSFRSAEPDTEPLQPSTELSPAPVVPGYEVLDELGRGGMGVVYRARQIHLQRIVALKMILAGSHAGTVELARFRTEAEAIARLQHANIVQVHEVGEHEGKPYFSLEFCGGGSLAHKINGTPLAPEETARLVETLARGIDAAHQKNIIHRDLKPANVLLLEDGTPKITDFGLAKKLDDVGQTQSGAIMGTPSYMAPEQAGGNVKELGPAADIYALGAILYECLTGRPPFKAATPLDTILQVVSQDPVPPSQLNSKTPRDLETICLKCLQKEPGKRYTSALDLAEDLRRFQAGEPILARPVSAIEKAFKWVKRRPVVAGLTAATVLLVLAGTVVSWVLTAWALGEADRADRAADEERDQRARAVKLASDNEKLAVEEKAQRVQVEKMAQANKQLALKEEKARLESDEGRKKAETLLVQLKFEQAFLQAEDNRALRMLTLAGLLREPIVQENPTFEESLRLHLGGYLGESKRLKHTFSFDGFASVVAVAFSSDGKAVLTGHLDSKAQLTLQWWDTVTGKPIGPSSDYKNAHVMAFSPDAKTLLTASPASLDAQLWDTATRKPLCPPLKVRVTAAVFSPEGKTVLTGWGSKQFPKNGAAYLWDAVTGKQLAGPMPMPHQGPIEAMAFSAHGTMVLTGSTDTTAQLWETATGKPLAGPLQHHGSVMAVAFSPDGKTVLTGSLDKTARFWDTATGQAKGAPFFLQHGVNNVAFSPNGKIAAARTVGGWVQLFVTATGKPLGPAILDKVATPVVFSADGIQILTGSFENTVQLTSVPVAVQGNPERILLWVQVLNGMDLDEQGRTRVLDANTLQERRQQLEKLGGPPQD